MLNFQSGILEPVPRLARFLSFAVKPDSQPAERLRSFCRDISGKETIVGLGASLLQAMGVDVPGLREFPAKTGAGFNVPSTGRALWCWVRGEEPQGSQAFGATTSWRDYVAFGMSTEQMSGVAHLTGYEDGTENPQGEEALNAAFVRGEAEARNGSSFVATQLWVHDLDYFRSMTQEEQDNIIGRRKSDNEELPDAPRSAHVKRTAQESFTPQAFLLRASPIPLCEPADTNSRRPLRAG